MGGGGCLGGGGNWIIGRENPNRKNKRHDHFAGKEQKPPQLIQIAAAAYRRPQDHHTKFLVGLDVGSTTVKATVVDAATDEILWQDYQRHEGKRREQALGFLGRRDGGVGMNPNNQTD